MTDVVVAINAQVEQSSTDGEYRFDLPLPE